MAGEIPESGALAGVGHRRDLSIRRVAARKGPSGGERLSRARGPPPGVGGAGFRSAAAAPPGAAEVSATIRRLGLLQLDFVNVLAPAHYLVLFSRLGTYDRSLLDEVVAARADLGTR